MRALLISSLAFFASAAFAQNVAERPSEAAPQASASFETRETWCQKYAAWFVAQAPGEGAAPADVAPSHRFEVEFNSCKPDPQQYEFDTRSQLAQSAETEADASG